jgi:Mor family transcriptional regulator
MEGIQVSKKSDGFIQSLLSAISGVVGEGSFSEQHAEQITRQICCDWGGAEVYIPKVDPLRRERVMRKFNGRNRKEVCAEEGLSKSQFYEILKGG